MQPPRASSSVGSINRAGLIIHLAAFVAPTNRFVLVCLTCCRVTNKPGQSGQQK